MDGEAQRLTRSASNKAHGQGSGRGIKGRGLEGGGGGGEGGGVRRSGGSANEGWETRGREGKNVIKTGKREIGGKRGKPRCTGDLCQLYNFLQRMPSTLPSPPTPASLSPVSLFSPSLPLRLSRPPQYPTVPPGCAPPRRRAEEAVPGHTSQ